MIGAKDAANVEQECAGDKEPDGQTLYCSLLAGWAISLCGRGLDGDIAHRVRLVHVLGGST
jgi:hypothetical protein